ncbi:hypothetical protein [Paenibacillus daejeonensis]|uniref:hypothetical protein n=1 Tax=Paenibacillus daejeonensis TaxID=135193 RepID=UPI0003606A2E|nr:hypothetical protein [Paenibacillus daejeonensis]
MNAAQGTARLIYEDARWFLVKLLFLYITLPLTAAWVIIGIFFEQAGSESFLIGPAYFFFIPYYGAAGFKSLLPIAVGLGSTRTQLLKMFYLVGTSLVLVYMLFLNLCQWLLAYLHQEGISSASILHPGQFYSSEHQFLPYLWIDLMIGMLLFGSMFFLYCITYRLGMKRTLIGISILGMVTMLLVYSGALGVPTEWLSLMNMNAMTGFTLAGAVGLMALLATYPIMRNASLLPKTSID